MTLPSTLGIDPLRLRRPENEEQPISPIYGSVFVTDREEGLLIVSVGTLVDGDPANNFLREKDVTRYNPLGLLRGATHSFMAGNNLYLTCTNGLFVIDISTPNAPRIVGQLTNGFLKNPRAVAIQFRYAFITDEEGLKVCEISDPQQPKALPNATIPLKDAGRHYLARTYAYVPDGAAGLAIIDIQNPVRPKLVEHFTAKGKINDARAVQIGSIAASEYALLADGKNGLRVIQLISPDTVPTAMGFSPKPSPRLIATRKLKHGEARAVSRGLDRDRIVDESGNQTVVFGRRGSRPFNWKEMTKFFRHGNGSLYTVEDVDWRDGNLITKSGKILEAPPLSPLLDTSGIFELPADLPLRIPRRPTH